MTTNTMLPSGISVRIREDLVDGASRVQTTLIIDPIITLDGHRVTMDDIGDLGFGKLDGGGAREELISWTGITDNTSTYTLTGCTWGINFYDLNNSVNNYRRHTSGSRFEIKTDMHYTADQFVSRYTPEVKDNFIPTELDHLTTKDYVDTRNGYWEGAVADYASLPVGAVDGEARITLDDSKMYIYDTDTSTWTITGAGGGAGTVYIDTFLGTDAVGGDNRTFQLTSGSFPLDRYLQVYLNGTLMELGATEDYTTATSNQAIFNYDVLDTDKITLLVVSVDLYNPEWNNVNGDILPDVNNAYDIGSSTKKFKDIYGNGENLTDGSLGKLHSIDPANPASQSFATLVGGTDVVLADFITLGDGANDAAIKTTIDGTEYDNLDVDLKVVRDVSTITSNTTSSGTTTATSGTSAQSFTTAAETAYLTGFSYQVLTSSLSATAANYTLREGGVINSGTILASGVATIDAGTGTVLATFDTDIAVSPSTSYNWTMTPTGGSWLKSFGSSNPYPGGYNDMASDRDYRFAVYGKLYNTVTSLDNVADTLQLAIRAATGGEELVVYDTDHFLISSTVYGFNNGGEVLKFTAPTSGTDIGVAGYLDLATNATEVTATGDDGKLVRLDSTSKVPPLYLYSPYFGDGSDGDVIISTNTSLSRDMYYDELTINSGITLQPNGYRIFVKRLLINNGIIAEAGGDGGAGGDGIMASTNSSRDGGTAGTGGSGTGGGTINGASGGVAGKVGAISVSELTSGSVQGLVGAAGSGGASVDYGIYSTTFVTGAAGGTSGSISYAGWTDRGTTAGGAGGAPGSVTALREQPHRVENIINFYEVLLSGIIYYKSLPTNGGAGSGASGSVGMTSGYNIYTASGGGSGGNGGNGGMMIIIAREIINNGVIACTGGAGGAGGTGGAGRDSSYETDANSGAGGGGGGTGGNGGIIALLYSIYTGTAVDVSGGAGGAGGAGGVSYIGTSCTGTDGSAGGTGGTGVDGLVIEYII